MCMRLLMAGRGAVGTRMEFVMWMKYSAVLHSAGLCKERNTAEKDMIGPPDPVSNIRPIRPRRPKSKAEIELQKLQMLVCSFNHDFWKGHNMDFQERKAWFIQRTLREKEVQGVDADDRRVTARELSLFYKEFLDRKYLAHMNYSKNWLKLNCTLTWLFFKVRLAQLVRFKL